VPKGKKKRAKKQTDSEFRIRRPFISKGKLLLLVIPTALVLLVVFSIPLSAILVDMNRERILDYIDTSYSGHIHAGSVKGNILTGLVLEDLYFLPEGEMVSLPVWVGDRLTIQFRIPPLFSGKWSPKKIILENFIFRFEQAPDGTFRLPPLYPGSVNAQGGQFNLDDIKIIVNNSKVTYEENPKVWASPLHLEAERIYASGTYFKGNNLRIHRADCRFIDSNLNFHGKMETIKPYKSDLMLEMKDVGMWQLAEALGRLFESDRKIRPSGTGNVNAKISGPILNPKLDGKCTLDDAKFGNFRFGDAHFTLSYLDKKLKLNDGVAIAYDGRVALNGSVNASQNPPTFELDAQIIDLNLSSYLGQTVEGLNPVFGKFSGEFHGFGDFKNPDLFVAKASLRCDKGMYMNPFKGAETGFLEIRQKDKMGFDSLNIDINLQKESVAVNEFHFSSQWIDITASGRMQFDGTLEILGVISADSVLLKVNKQFAQIARFLPLKNIKVPVKFRLNGTPRNYVVYTALSEETINSLLGDDEARKAAARQLLDQYFGDSGYDTDNVVEDVMPDVEENPPTPSE
jgi:hypothetical protein